MTQEPTGYDPDQDPDADPAGLNPRTGGQARSSDADEHAEDADTDADTDADPRNLNPRGGTSA